MRSRFVLEIAIEIALVAVVIVAAGFLGTRVAFAMFPDREPSYTHATFELKDGTVLHANTPDEIESIRKKHRGQILRGKLERNEAQAVELAGNLLITSLGLIFLAVWAIIRHRLQLRAWFTLGGRWVLRTASTAIALAVGGQAATMIAAMLGVSTDDWSNSIIEMFNEFPISSATLLIVVAPITEELYFRGRVLDRVTDWIGLRWGVAISSILFAMAHPILPLMPAYALAGVCLAVLRLRTKSLVPSILAHAATNSVVVLAIGLRGPS